MADFILTKYGAFTRESIEALFEAARELHERVEMDESVGICLSDRAASLNLGDIIGEGMCQ